MSSEKTNPVGVIPITPKQHDSVAIVSPQIEKLRELGKKIIVGTMMVGEVYKELVEHIRTQKISNSTATSELKALGFHKVRVAEIIKVAESPVELYDAYQARTIGFKKALTLTREHLKEIAQAKELPNVTPDALNYEPPKELAPGKPADVVAGEHPTVAADGSPVPPGPVPPNNLPAEKVLTKEQQAALKRLAAIESIREGMKHLLSQALASLKPDDQIVMTMEEWSVVLHQPKVQISLNKVAAAKAKLGKPGKGTSSK